MNPRIFTRAATLAGVLGAAPLAAQPPAGNWQYAWGDDFSGTTLDTSKWSYNYPWGTTHNHNATMRPENIRFEGAGSPWSPNEPVPGPMISAPAQFRPATQRRPSTEATSRPASSPPECRVRVWLAATS